jgi:mono/diheme cytochrome c family protein
MMKYLAAAALTVAITAPAAAQDAVARGEYLVKILGCNDCHTPFAFGPNGPEPDMTRMLSGHPEQIVISAPATLVEPWMSAGNGTNTAHSGPWGVSFSANLTSDPETGVLRDYNEEQFLLMMRTGRHLGQGRPILPPMPWPPFGMMTDDDLKAVFAYLKQVPAIRNKVPDPLPPA